MAAITPHWRRRCAAWGSIAGMLALMVGCATEEQPAASTPAASATAAPQTGAPSAAPSASSTPVKPAFTFPLTGLPSEQEITDRPIMVMIENSPGARPQTGLDQADLVYEVLAEFEVTRFAAFYQSEKPAVIGPVRSIRPYYVRLGEGHGAIVVHAGWSQAAMDLMVDHKINHLDQVYGDDKYYWRDTSRKAPHNLYTSIEKILEGAAAKKFGTVWDKPALHFAEQPEAVPVSAGAGSAAAGAAAPAGTGAAAGTAATPSPSPAGGQSARKITIPYLHGYSVVYDWSEANGSYARSMAGAPHADPVSGRTLAADNILIAESKHRTLDKDGRREVDVVGPGKGWLIQSGQARSVTWEAKDGIIRPYTDNGQELPLVPGKTWVQVVPVGTAVTME